MKTDDKCRLSLFIIIHHSLCCSQVGWHYRALWASCGCDCSSVWVWLCQLHHRSATDLYSGGVPGSPQNLPLHYCPSSLWPIRAALRWARCLQGSELRPYRGSSKVLWLCATFKTSHKGLPVFRESSASGFQLWGDFPGQWVIVWVLRAACGRLWSWKVRWVSAGTSASRIEQHLSGFEL